MSEYEAKKKENSEKFEQYIKQQEKQILEENKEKLE